MYKTFLLVGIGGALGSTLRYFLGLFLKSFSPVFPLGTLAANLLGCVCMGLVMGFSERFNWFSVEWRLFLASGFCGGFTTFSAFAFENIRLLQTGDYKTFILYTFSSLVVTFLAVVLGLMLAKLSW
ncbi:MAG TPA: fluoride efflux transporter CrcB [Cytophagales bacterium]|jgi:CrcB protein|nr:fluoride efflux transporter CrcB [Cytophagales bacterium]